MSFLKNWLNVIYWPSTEAQSRGGTTVSRWTLENYITRCHRQLESFPVGVGVSWGTRCQCENQLADWGLAALSDPRLSNPSQDWGRSAAIVRRTWGQYVTICPSLQLTSHTQPTSTLSRIKCVRYFSKEV